MTLLLKKLIFKNGFVGDITLSKKEEIFTKSPRIVLMISSGVFEVFTRIPDK